MKSPDALDPRTRRLLEGPIVPTLLRLAVPTLVIMSAQSAVSLIETYFIGMLGTEALAGMSLVFPMLMLMLMLSGGAMGGGIASAIARALGAGRRAEADALVCHAAALGLVFGLVFTVIFLLGGRWIYSLMGGTGAALQAALAYSDLLFCAAVLIWVFNALAAALRGTGNMTLQAVTTFVGMLLLLPLSPLLIFGWGPVPAMGIAGGAAAVIAYYAAGILVLAGYLRSRRSVLQPFRTPIKFRWPLFREILRVGLGGVISGVATNLNIVVTTAFVGGFGVAAIAGYGTAARLEYLLVPIAFGIGGPLVAMVGVSLGAGDRRRAMRVAWAGAAMATVLTEAVGLWAAFFPLAWLGLFNTDPVALAEGARYLRVVGPTYGFFGLGLALYFASQGVGRLKWPIAGNVVRLLLGVGGATLALKLGGDLGHVFAAQAIAMAAYGLVIAGAIAGGGWFGPLAWPASRPGAESR
ncbi:MAG: MATE family efflux transporter [Burkholderiaceae bacterium]|nr:MATE family efflux transporter [Burkholderiaceae bacterium]MDO9089995.1 MATE family efflux transporter [Burkholderiaceae bacterium]